MGEHRHYEELHALGHVFSTFNAEVELDQHIYPRVFRSFFDAQSSPLSSSWTQSGAGCAEEQGSPVWCHPCSVAVLGPALPGFYAGQESQTDGHHIAPNLLQCMQVMFKMYL